MRLVLASIAIYARGWGAGGGGGGAAGVWDQASDSATCDFGMLSL